LDSDIEQGFNTAAIQIMRAFVSFLVVLAVAASPAKLPDESPSPKLTPEQVVGVQLAALTADAPESDRIAACYRFASPANRAHTGPIEKFATLFELPGYRTMLDARRYLVGKAIVKGDEAYLLATMVDRDGDVALFRFFLSKQKDPPNRDCWMTDTVIRLERLAPPAPPRPKETAAI
jgi:hypothetical protein